MNKVMFLFLMVFFLLPRSHAGRQLELEHSYLELEGSSWGIEGHLKDKLNISEEDLPALFKVPLNELQPATYTFNGSLNSDGKLFVNDTVFLYKKMNVCIDARIGYKSTGFDLALNNFSSKIAQVSPGVNPLEIQFTDFDFENFKDGKASDCDAFAFIGKKDQFPFSQVQDLPAPSFSKIPQKLLGMYFRLSKSTVPVVVFNPSLSLDFRAAQGQYLRLNERDGLVVDARTLFFHELGHLFGLSHVKKKATWGPFANLTVMGVDSSQSKDNFSDFRYQAHFEIWQNWDMRQTSLYRAIFSRWVEAGANSSEVRISDLDASISGNCVLPGEYLHVAFTPLHISALLKDDLALGREGLFDLTRTPPLVYKDARVLMNQYAVTAQEILRVMEYNRDLRKTFFSPQFFERTITKSSDLAEATNAIPGTRDEWLLLTLSGRIDKDVTGFFRLSGVYGVNENVKTFFPAEKMYVEEQQRNCFKKK